MRPKKFTKKKMINRITKNNFFKRKRYCRFTAEGIKWVDYKDVQLLKNYISENGKIISC